MLLHLVCLDRQFPVLIRKQVFLTFVFSNDFVHLYLPEGKNSRNLIQN